jgi:hypothetical protein
LSEEPSALDETAQRFFRHLFEQAPELQVAAKLA